MFLGIIFLIDFLLASQNVYEKFNVLIHNKIENEDFVTININKKYMRISLDFEDEKNIFIIKILTFNYDYEILVESSKIKISCCEQTIENIVQECEDELLIEYKRKLPDSIVLIYDTKSFETIPTYKKIINYIKKVNDERKNTDLSLELWYEYIIDEHVMWSIMFPIIMHQNLDLYDDLTAPHSKIKLIKRNDKHLVCFCIKVEDVLCFIEIDIREIGIENLSPVAIVDIAQKNETDMQISEYFNELYKTLYIDVFKLNSYSCFGRCSINKITFLCSKFTIEIIDDEIHFRDNYNYYIYSTKKENIIDVKCLFEFLEIFKKISVIKSNEEHIASCVLFFRLIEYNRKVEFLVNRILSTPRSALNIMFTHLLLEHKLIHEDERIKLIDNEGICDQKLKNKILNMLLFHGSLSRSFLIKICLFLEAEKYINEVDVIEDNIFSTLKKIGILILKKEHTKTICVSVTSKNKNIDLLKIYQELITCHLENIRAFMLNIWDHFFKIASLCTGLESNSYEIGWNEFFIRKEQVVHFLGFDDNEVKIKNELLKKKLSENLNSNLKKDHIYDILYKKIKTKLFTKLNKINSEALNLKVLIPFDEEVYVRYETELKERGIREIENTFLLDDALKKLSKNENICVKKLINDYKIEEKEIFYENLKVNIKENIKRNCKKKFNPTFSENI
ncbi:uncharacterized protein VNE69_08131 [Vairimorpha necatrix]|uniref:Uncharacterized protein n=1 Tax=Vairimorpha necatrix TaxID=6039 RepID=A0AAX4JEI0_9MICR